MTPGRDNKSQENSSLRPAKAGHPSILNQAGILQLFQVTVLCFLAIRSPMKCLLVTETLPRDWGKSGQETQGRQKGAATLQATGKVANATRSCFIYRKLSLLMLHMTCHDNKTAWRLMQRPRERPHHGARDQAATRSRKAALLLCLAIIWQTTSAPCLASQLVINLKHPSKMRASQTGRLCRQM